MDRPFEQPLRLGNGQTVVLINSPQEAGCFLLQHWPPRKRRCASYREAVIACVRAVGGTAEPEAARQALLIAVMDLRP